MSRKTPAQVLFERIYRSWVAPELARRAPPEPILLSMVLLVWGPGSTLERVLLNHEVSEYLEAMEVVTTRAVSVNAPVLHDDIGGLGKLRVRPALWKKACLLIVLGKDSKYFVRGLRLGTLPEAVEFKRLEHQLATEGVSLRGGTTALRLHINLRVNTYTGTPAQKRARFIQLCREEDARVRSEVRARVRRELKLPPFIIHHDEDATSLLVEARQAYVSAYYFSTVAAAITTADKICNNQAHRYLTDKTVVRRLLTRTLGQKIQELAALGLISKAQEALLRDMNEIRNRHLHPKQPVSRRRTATDALRSIKLLHELIDGTESVFRDYTLAEGRLVPRPLA